MCGFAGCLMREGGTASRRDAVAMRDLLAHRGPDDRGLLLLDTRSGEAHPEAEQSIEGANLAFGFRRLSILDLSQNGHQPMSSPDGSCWMMYNGEVYNYVELRAEMSGSGRPFRSSSDTEVVLALYEERGTAAIAALNGMFALAIWDQKRRRLLLARDRLGIKPLYWASVGGTVVFGSEIKAVLAHPAVSRRLDPRGVIEGLSFQYPLEDRTMFADVRSLEPGTLLVADDAGLRIEPFWKLRFEAEDRKPADFAEDLRCRLLGAVRRQVRSDVPVGTYLSGGMDTGAVSTLAKGEIGRLHSFTCGFDVTGLEGDERFFDERPEARAMAHHLGTLHHEIEVRPADMLALLPRIVWHLDEPRAGISYQIYAMAAEVRRHVTVVLSGVGGDELFAGYPWRYGRVLGLDGSGAFDDAYYKEWCRLVTDERREAIFTPEALAAAGGTPRDGFDSVMGGCTSRDPLERALYFDTRCFLQALLVVDDRLSMAHSLEARVPLLDNDVLDLVTRIPARLKFDGADTKMILKKAMAGVLPEECFTRRKQGFTPPDRSWYRHHTWEGITGLLLSERFLARGWFLRSGIEAMLADHRSGRSNHRFLIWALLCFEWMNRLFVDDDRPLALPVGAFS